MRYLAQFSTYWIAALMWLAGIVLAKGFWLTVLSVVMPFYAWYLVVQRIMQANGLL